MYIENVLFHFRYTDDVSIDAEVLVEESNNLIPTKVTHVSTVTMRGKNVTVFFAHCKNFSE